MRAEVTSGNSIPSNGVSDSSKYPVEFPQRSTTIVQTARYSAVEDMMGKSDMYA